MTLLSDTSPKAEQVDKKVNEIEEDLKIWKAEGVSSWVHCSYLVHVIFRGGFS
jgi:hypothetical protein